MIHSPKSPEILLNRSSAMHFPVNGRSRSPVESAPPVPIQAVIPVTPHTKCSYQ
jgi:hypothetical protein